MKMAFTAVITLFAVLGGSFVTSKAEHDSYDLFTHADSGARIVGGTPAKEGSVLNMVAISVGSTIKTFICGGSLITEKHVLTAAHCVEALYSNEALPKSLRVRVGSNRWNAGGHLYDIASNVTHQDYDSFIVKNDIAILMTSSRVILSKTVKPITLSYEFIGGDVQARAAGWGYTKNGGPLSEKLLELTVKTITGDQCINNLPYSIWKIPPIDPELEICTFHSKDHGMCNGDSGSALVNVGDGKQIGIVSWGLPCALGAPDMFVRVSAYKTWIENATA